MRKMRGAMRGAMPGATVGMMRGTVRGWVVCSAVLLCVGGAGLRARSEPAVHRRGSQQGGLPAGQQPVTPAARLPSLAMPEPELSEEQKAHIARLLSTERVKRMRHDADELVRLANELKADVDATTRDEMSVATIKKAAEAEKLARDIKDRMRGQ